MAEKAIKERVKYDCLQTYQMTRYGYMIDTHKDPYEKLANGFEELSTQINEALEWLFENG